MDEEREVAAFMSGLLIGRGALGATAEEMAEAWHLYRNNLPGNPFRSQEEVIVWPEREEVTAWPFWMDPNLNVN